MQRHHGGQLAQLLLGVLNTVRGNTNSRECRWHATDRRPSRTKMEPQVPRVPFRGQDHEWYPRAVSWAWSRRSPRPKGHAMRGKQIAITAVIALVVVVGFNTYQAKKSS